MKISIITPWHGPTAHLLPDYSSAVQGDEVVTVDNACPESTAKPLREFTERVGGIYIRNDVNAGFAGGNNQGWSRATGDVIVFLNSDVYAVSSPHWLAQVYADVRDGSLYGPSCHAQTVYGMPVPYIEGWCIAAARKTWERLNVDGIGPWDAAAYPDPYWEDNDLSLRALNAGIDLVPVQWNVQHKGSATIGPSVLLGDVYERNRATFAARVRETWEKTVKVRP